MLHVTLHAYLGKSLLSHGSETCQMEHDNWNGSMQAYHGKLHLVIKKIYHQVIFRNISMSPCESLPTDYPVRCLIEALPNPVQVATVVQTLLTLLKQCQRRGTCYLWHSAKSLFVQICDVPP